jgi:hypothetical protein
MESANPEKTEFFQRLFIIPEERNCDRKVLKKILKKKLAPDVPVFQKFFLKSTKSINESYRFIRVYSFAGMV